MSEDIKIALKDVRDLVKHKDYNNAIKRCKKILKNNKNNYSALVLLGAAMREVAECKRQAPLAFQKAIEVQPDNPLAWQGLVAYYERESEDTKGQIELARAYCKLLSLEENPEKFSDFLDKLSNLCSRIQHEPGFSDIAQTLGQLRDVVTGEKQRSIDKTLAWILTECAYKEMKFDHLLRSILASVTKDSNVANRREYFGRYLRILYEKAEVDVLITEAKVMHELFPEDVRPLEWICRLYYENYVSKGARGDVSYFYEALLQLEPQSVAGRVAKAVHSIETGNFIDARDHLNRIAATRQLMFHTWYLLSVVHAKLHCWEDAERASKRAIELFDTADISLQHTLNWRLIESLVHSKNAVKWVMAREMCSKQISVQESSSCGRLKVLLARVKVLLDEPGVTEELLALAESDSEIRAEVILLRALYLRKHKRLEEAVDVLLGSKLESTEAWSLLGDIYWEMADYNHGLVAFLNAVQADRCNWECFVRLGYYYFEHGNDVDRARRCYQTAFLINPNSEEAGIGLSTAYRRLKDSDANMQLLRRITVQENAPKWAWLQLGLQYLDEGGATEAIRALQCAIRADPTNNHSWESLADAYQARGAHTSALRAYQRALELSPGSLYPMIQLANVKLVIGQYEEAMEDFRTILEKEGRYVPALKGVAEAHLALAGQDISKQLLCRARENLQLAVDNLTLAIVRRNDIACLWKLLGDACYRVAATMPDKHCHLQLSSALAKANNNEQPELGTSERRNLLFVFSSRCYCRALTLSRDSALLWHDLACCYFAQSRYDLSDTTNAHQEGDGERAIDKALAAAKLAVTLCPTLWFHWNILGVICMSDKMKNYALAQHSFVMAIDSEPNNATTWTNLGTLYLHLGDPYRANEAFSRAQRADPGYVNSWAGQALIAEKMHRKDAMDLFRHSTELGYHDQAALGYAHWVLTALLDRKSTEDPLYTYIIENMHAIPVASDALHWFNERHPNNSYALNAHGLLLERLKLYRSAAERFELALRCCCEAKRRDSLRVNLSRILMELARYTEAIELCRTVENANFNSQCHLALALFKANRHEESYGAYEAALHWLANEGSDKAHVLCAMAAMAHIFQGADDAKTLLFQCLRIQPSIVAGFLAAAALGILHNDVNLTTLVLNELRPFANQREYRHQIATLSAYARLSQDDMVGAVRLLCSTIHRYPDETGCWLSLVRLLSGTGANAFPRCVRKALYVGRNASTATRLSMHTAYALSLTHSKSKSINGEALRCMQRTVFTFPAYSESWANFIAALLSRSIAGPSESGGGPPSLLRWLSSLISVVLDALPTTVRLANWLYENKRKIDFN